MGPLVTALRVLAGPLVESGATAAAKKRVTQNTEENQILKRALTTNNLRKVTWEEQPSQKGHEKGTPILLRFILLSYVV